MDRRTFLTAVAATTAITAGCTSSGGDGGGGDGNGGGGGQAASPTGDGAATADATVAMKNTTFQPLKVEVDAGGTVEWVNEDGFQHTVTSAQFHDVAASWSFDEQVAGGKSVTHTFEQQGVYEYYCTVHGKSQMCGAVLVGGATLEKRLPCGEDDGGG
ncbi:MAG: plastocyanin/azurin family copper-binding protein, partial [Haloglomus sp.]